VDTFTVDDTLYIKVIDYKSSGKDVNPSDLYHGLQIQLIFYMNAALKAKAAKGISASPAAVLYYHINDPMIRGDYHTTNDALEQEILKELKVKGLVNASDVVIEGLDKEIYEKGVSQVIPVKIKKDHTPDANSKVATEEEFKLLTDFVEKKVTDLGNRIASGDIAALPYCKKSRTGCDYCEYHSICGFDPRMDGYEYRRLMEYKDGDAYEKMREELDDGVDR
jgi:ATP-dependent helicase/nuclease subunit B